MMKSVGEVMAMGRTWIESFQKALRGMETGLDGWDLPKNYKKLSREEVGDASLHARRLDCAKNALVVADLPVCTPALFTFRASSHLFTSCCR